MKAGEQKQLTEKDVEVLFESPYVKVADLRYAPGKHYYDATRREIRELTAIKSDEEFRDMLADAVSCFVILDMPREQPRLLLSREYRYPVGRFMLSVPAGLIDEEDKGKEKEEAVLAAAVREIQEETGLVIRKERGDRTIIVNPLVFSTPGLTDESNALVCAVLHPRDTAELSQEGAVGSELFDGFELLTRDMAMETLRKGRDREGNFYPLYTWAALMYFISDMWKEE